MAIKLYNKTRCPDKILRAIVTAAGQRIGCDTNIVVKVTQGQCLGGSGRALHGFPYLWHLTRKRQKDSARDRVVSTRGGWIELVLPGTHPAWDVLLQAEKWYELCLHEWGHVKDFQTDFMPGREWSRRGESGRRPNWEDRPEEKRACMYAARGQERARSKTADEAILALASWLEEKQKRGA